MATTYTVTQVLSAAGVNCEPTKRNQAALNTLWRELEGTVVSVSDKDIVLAFPTRTAAEQFKAEGKKRRAYFSE